MYLIIFFPFSFCPICIAFRSIWKSQLYLRSLIASSDIVEPGIAIVGTPLRKIFQIDSNDPRQVGKDTFTTTRDYGHGIDLASADGQRTPVSGTRRATHNDFDRKRSEFDGITITRSLENQQRTGRKDSDSGGNESPPRRS